MNQPNHRKKRFYLFSTLVLGAGLVFAGYSTARASVDFGDEKGEPLEIRNAPFYMMNFFEINHVSSDQRELYFSKTAEQIEELRSRNIDIDDISKEDLRIASSSRSTWESVMLKVRRACKSLESKKTCNDLVASRLVTLNQGARHSLVDRKAIAKRKVPR